jgi:guanine deaminase
LAGLNKNVFPEESRDADPAYATGVVEQFLRDTVSQGVVGGSAYMTVHAQAARTALRLLPERWFVGMVLMNMNCPPYLRTDEAKMEQNTRSLAGEFGPRVVVTDRFAVSVDTILRKRAVKLAEELGLRTQTHLNEQRAEKALVENTLYPNYDSYTDVYAEDGLLDCAPAIMAHCIHMKEDEFRILRDKGAWIAHCPTSNSLLGSGIMNLDEVNYWKIPWCLCTDVGASPTTSLLCEMEHFLLVHSGRNNSATPSSALFGVTLAPAKMLGLDKEIGSFRVGKKMSFIEIEPGTSEDMSAWSADDVILHALLQTSRQDILDRTRSSAPAGFTLAQLAQSGLEEECDVNRLRDEVESSIRRLENKVQRVTINGMEIWKRGQ